MRRGRDPQSALVGRREDSEKLASKVYDTPVVVFTGASGVGKTSMLQLELIPTLHNHGYEPLLVDDWNRSTQAKEAAPNTIDELVFRQVEQQLPARAKLRTRDGNSLLQTLDQLYPDRSVIILDQFEELIRYQPKEFQNVLRWIERAASETRVRVVISLRVEYEHELHGVRGLKLGPFTQERHELKPISDRARVKQVISGPDASYGNGAITDLAAERILQAWTSAEDALPSDRGLLHLQALLLVLWSRKEGRTIELSDVNSLIGDWIDEDGVDGETGRLQDGSTIFRRALSEAVKVSLERCREACGSSSDDKWPGLDAQLAARTMDVVRTLGVHLTSGGYKVSHGREDLARLVLFREGGSSLERFASNVELARSRLAELVDSSTPLSVSAKDDPQEAVSDWLSIPRSELFGADPLDAFPNSNPETRITAGVLLGLRPEDSLLEEYRCFYFALEWLRLSELIRLTMPSRGKTMVTLIHDLFGDGLLEWGSSVDRGAGTAMRQFVALRGQEMNWSSRETHSTVGDGVVANLRWLACEIESDFKDVTFVNCDFRGTTFVRSSFQGVAMVNCMLDDAEFRDCTIVGSPRPSARSNDLEAETPNKPPPSFFITDVPRTLLTSLDWYREPRRSRAGQELGLYSQTAGVAAVPAPRHGDVNEILFEPEQGGLSVVGGRISSLKVRGCDFGVDGRLSLRHVAGTSVEFADQVRARLEVYKSAIRGFTITRPVAMDHVDFPNPTSEECNEADPCFDMRFSDSLLINVWFGVGLTGIADFMECRVWQVFNAADRDRFIVSMPGTPYYGVVNTEPLNVDWQMDFSADSLGINRGDVWRASQTIDYRERPLPRELK